MKSAFLLLVPLAALFATTLEIGSMEGSFSSPFDS
jgi:hypothetical protein